MTKYITIFYSPKPSLITPVGRSSKLEWQVEENGEEFLIYPPKSSKLIGTVIKEGKRYRVTSSIYKADSYAATLEICVLFLAHKYHGRGFN